MVKCIYSIYGALSTYLDFSLLAETEYSEKLQSHSWFIYYWTLCYLRAIIKKLFQEFVWPLCSDA